MAQRVEDIEVGTIESMLDAMRVDLGLSRVDIVAALHMTDTELASWRATGARPDEATLQRLQTLVGLRDGLQELFAETEGVHEWMHAELRDLRWRTPQQAFRDGDLDEVYAAFVGLASGIFI